MYELPREYVTSNRGFPDTDEVRRDRKSVITQLEGLITRHFEFIREKLVQRESLIATHANRDESAKSKETDSQFLFSGYPEHLLRLDLPFTSNDTLSSNLRQQQATEDNRDASRGSPRTSFNSRKSYDRSGEIA